MGTRAFKSSAAGIMNHVGSLEVPTALFQQKWDAFG